MSDFKAKMHEIRFQPDWGSVRKPSGELTVLHRPAKLYLRGLLLRDRKWKGRDRKESEEKGREGGGREGKGKDASTSSLLL